MRSRFALTLVLSLICLVVPGTGCTKGAPTESKAFATAPAEAKAMWETTRAAIKTNGYVVALLELHALRLRTDLTPQQEQVVDDTSRALSDQLYKEADKGDQKAKAAIEELRNTSKR